MAELQIRNIVTGSEEFEQAQQLVKSLGLPFRETASAEVQYLAAFDGGQLLGYLAMEKIQQTLHIHQLAVSKPVQRSGIGSRLLSRAEQWAITNACTRIEVNTAMAAIRFFEDLAYSRTHEAEIIAEIPYVKMIKDWSVRSN